MGLYPLHLHPYLNPKSERTIGVAIMISNENGEFTFPQELLEDDVLVVSYLGYETDEVKIALEHGEIIEQYSEDHPFPSYLIWAHLSKHKIIHVVVALDIDDKMLWVITVYVPAPEEWEEDYKRRRRQ